MIWLQLGVFWASCLIAGYLYTQPRGVPIETVFLVAPAFLLEATLFLCLGVEKWRRRLESYSRPAIAGMLICAAAAPYLLASVATGTFSWTSLGAVAGLGAILAGWYLVLPAHPASDIGLILVAVAVMIFKPFEAIYVRPDPRLALEALGQAMWFRTGLFAMISIRRISGIGFGFWPSKREWIIGVSHFAVLLPIAAVLGAWIEFTSLDPPTATLETAAQILLTFFGTLWVLALGEEFLFRGLIQQWLSQWLHSKWTGLALTSLLFGSAHLPYREFPNWKFALMATLAGVFYGLAYQRAKGIRASMVIHALTVTTWRTFFT